MSTCTTNTCGTGGWATTNPDDPDNNSVLTATPAFGGIDVEWTYPETNSENVAYTILYRGTSDSFDDAVRHKIVSGNFFYDKTTTATAIKYYYWIEIVSVYGTVGDTIGPASATARPTIEQMLELLTGQIDSGVLATSLKTAISEIETNKLGLSQEILDRAANDDALGASYNTVEAFSNETRALLEQEVLARTSADEAFVSQVNTLYSTLGDAIASVQEEQTAQATDISSLSQALTTAQSKWGDDIASVQTTLQTSIDTLNGTVTSIGALYTAKVDVNGLIGGFAVYNDGTSVEAGFDVDTFWVGRTTNKVKPFIISGEEVYINEAVIQSLVFSKLRADDGSVIVQDGKLQASAIAVDQIAVNNIQSDNYVAGVSGWRLLQDGTFEINGSATNGGRIQITNTLFLVYDANGTLRVRMGIW